MELIYSMKRTPLKFEPPHYLTGSDPELNQPLVTVSISNIIAFTSPMELDDASGDTWGGHVYVCDIQTPWHSYKVTTTVYPITCLQWDEEGRQLLVGTTSGEVRVYVQTEFLLNKWHEAYSATFAGEHIMRGCFFHNGRKVVMNEKKTDGPVTERIQVLRSTPTLKGFGGSHYTGFLVATHTGLAGACARVGEATLTATECLGMRERVLSADIMEKDGALLICRVSREYVRTYAARVRGGAGAGGASPLAVTVTVMQAFHAPGAVSLRWWAREEGDCILVGGDGVALWNIVEKSHPIHKYLQKTPVGNTTPGSAPKPPEVHISRVWQQISQWRVSGDPCHVCHACPATRQALVRNNSTLFLISNDLPRELISQVIVPVTRAGASSPPKKPKFMCEGNPISVCVSGACVAPLGGCALCLDTHAQLHALALARHGARGDVSPSALQQLARQLQWAWCAGADCSALLLTLTQSAAEMLLERIMEQFQRQPPSYQQHYYQRWLKLRIALSRLVPSLEASGTWVTLLLMLEAAWAACGARLRQPDRLHKLLDTAIKCHEKNLVALECKMEPSQESVCLQALRRPLQLCADTALTVISSVPHQATAGYSLPADPTNLALLRKLIILYRASGAGGEALSRILGRMGPGKPDPSEECISVSSWWSGRERVWDILPKVTVFNMKELGQQFEYFLEPASLRHTPSPPPWLADCDVTPHTNMDTISYTYLGGLARGGRVLRCARCGARWLRGVRASPPLSAPHRAYCARFAKACRCGGQWTLTSST